MNKKGFGAGRNIICLILRGCDGKLSGMVVRIVGVGGGGGKVERESEGERGRSGEK